MQKRTFIVLLLLTTLAAMAAAWCWALPPLLTSVIYPHPTDWTQADVIRHIWHFRLVQPEWVSTPPEYLRWSQAEALARLIVVFLAWATTTCFLVRRYVIGHRDTPPNQTVRFRVGLRPELEQVSGGTCATCHARVILVCAETTRPLVPFTESHS